MTIDTPWTVNPIPTDEQTRTDEEMLLKVQMADASNRMAGEDGEPTTQSEPVPVDPVVELAAFAELLAHLAASDDSDAETVVTAITAEAFAEDAFTPASEEPHP